MPAKIKICGISTPEALDATIAARADYAGLVFYPASPRAVTSNVAGALTSRAAGQIAMVGLFVDADDAVIADALVAAKLNALQLHGSESPERVAQLRARGPVAHLVIDATGLKVYGEGEWKIRKHGKEKRRVWRKLHLAVDATTHAVIAAEVSLETVADNEVLPTLLNPLRRKIKQVSADGAYDTKACHALLKKKGAKATIPPRKNAAPWEEGHPRNEAVTALKAGELKQWKKDSGYHQRSIAETAMYRFKQLIGPTLSLRNYNAQVGEILAGVKVMNKLIGLGMPVRQPVN
ncbi:TPA: IS5 family transposase [Escherichia coli]|nr:IS5 family transposase [Escherichia coli]HBB0307820.1 IS5 family transposase [Escherichia coli]